MQATSCKRLAAVGACAAVALYLVGCTRAADGAARWAPNQATKPVEASETEQLLLDSDQLVEIIGSDLRTAGTGDEERPKSDSEFRRCDVMQGIGQRGFVGTDWEGFRARILTDRQGEDITHYVVEAGVVYPNNNDAKDALKDVAQKMDDCNGQEINNGDAGQWRYTVDSVSDHSVQWTTEQLDAVTDWMCYGEARVRGNVLLRGYTCRGDEQGREDTESILNKMSDTAWKLSSPGG